MFYIDEQDSALHDYENSIEELTEQQIRERLSKENISNHPTWFLKREVYKVLNGYRNILYCEDYDFVLRSLLQGFKIGKVNENLLKYRIRDNSITRSNALGQFINARETLKLYKRKKLNEEYLVKKFISKTKKITNENENKRFLLGHMYLDEGVENINRGQLVKGTFIILKSMLTSKYHLIKMYDIFVKKLRSKLNTKVFS